MAIVPSNPPSNTMQQPVEIKESLNDFLSEYVFRDSNLDRETGPMTPPRFPVYRGHPMDPKLAEMDRENSTPQKENHQEMKSVVEELREVLDGRKNRTGKSKTEILPKGKTDKMTYKDSKIIQLPPGQ